MSERLRRYRETRGGAADPLHLLEEHVLAGRPIDAAGLRELGQRTGLPPAALRGTLSFYGELASLQPAPRACRGTACTLARPQAPPAETDEGAAPGVYCLGYCDRGPATLDAEGRVHLASGGETPSAPVVRSIGREAIVTRRLLKGDHAGLERARAAGVYGALATALDRGPAWVLDEVERSGLQGRGGAGFPAGAKWRRCAEAPGACRYVIANADEGDPGSFIDRVLMEHDPHALLEGMILCAFAVGAGEGILFVRSEYPEAVRRLEAALAEARRAGILGPSVLGSGFGFEVRLFRALGSYVCGEETAMLNALEGLRGEVRLRPPYPAEVGLHGRPTVVNNVETLVNVPWIVERGADSYRALGTAASPGTKALCLSRAFTRPGIVETEFGVPLRRIVEREAGGGERGERLIAVLLGGPMGSLLGPAEWDVPVCYAAMAERGVALGHGGLVGVPESTDLAALVVHLLEFMAEESCGKCVPCRLGSQRALAMARSGIGPADLPAFEELLGLIGTASLCAFGQMTPGPVWALLARHTERIVRREAPA